MGGGGSTSTSGTFAPEVRGLFTNSSNALIRQQRDNPVGGYNYEHALNVEGADPFQEAGAQIIGGGANPTGLDALTLQSIMRAPGLAGAGPTTGQYDYASEPGLRDIMGFLNPSYAKSSSANAFPEGNDPSAPFTNEHGTNAPADDYSGLTDVLNQPSATGGGASGGSGGGAGGGGAAGGGAGGPVGTPDPNSRWYRDWNGQLRQVETGNAGREIGIAGHGRARFGDDGFLNPLYEQGSQGVATSPNQQRERFGRIWDSGSAGGAAANSTWQHPSETMSLQDLMSHGGADAAVANSFQHRFDPLPSAANNWGRGNNPAPVSTRAAVADTPEQAAYRTAQAAKKKAASVGTRTGGGSPLRG